MVTVVNNRVSKQFLDDFVNWLPAGQNVEPSSDFLVNVCQRKRDFLRDVESFSKIFTDFPLYPQFWHLTWIQQDLLTDGRTRRVTRMCSRPNPPQASLSEGKATQRLHRAGKD